MDRHYPGHFDEVVRIDQSGDEVEAVKITGDDYVPAGATTWRASLQTLRGEGQIAEEEFTRPGSSPAVSLSLTRNALSFVGKTAARSSSAATIESRRVGLEG